MNWKVLCYHTVDPDQAGSFAAQIRWYRAKGYEFLPFSEAFAARTRGAGRCVSLTFDDGDWTACAVAQKVLKDEGVRAILYLTTDYVTQGKTYKARNVRPAVTWKHLESWVSAGHEIGSHTHTHADLSRCGIPQLEDEMGKSRQMIEDRLGVVPVHFAYPWGRFNEDVVGWFQGQKHWVSAATVYRRGNSGRTNGFLLNRYVMEPNDDVHVLRLTLLPAPCRFLYRRLVGVVNRFHHNGKSPCEQPADVAVRDARKEL